MTDSARRPGQDDGLYEWYLDGWDFLADHWNRTLRAGKDIGEMDRVLEANRLMRERAWNRKVGNP